MTTRKRGGLLLSVLDRDAADARAYWFVPASIALEVVELRAHTPVDGLLPPAIGIALAGSEVVVVLGLEAPAGIAGPRGHGWRPGSDWPVPGANRAVLCDLGLERVAVVGGTIVATGVFDADADQDGVSWRDRRVPTLEVRSLYARADGAIWSERAARRAEARS